MEETREQVMRETLVNRCREIRKSVDDLSDKAMQFGELDEDQIRIIIRKAQWLMDNQSMFKTVRVCSPKITRT